MTEDLKKFLISQLRRLSYKWPAYSDAWKSAKVAYGQYVCAQCEEVFRRKDCQLDHIHPVVPLTGWPGIEQYCERLFCCKEHLEVLCLNCHREKTLNENAIRRAP